MKISSVALGSLILTACLGAPVQAEDASPYLCATTDTQCRVHKTDGLIPKNPQPNELVHIVKDSGFTLRKNGASIELWPALGDWLIQFYHAPLTWTGRNRLMPYAECPIPGTLPFKPKAAPTDPSTLYSNFMTTLNLHVNDNHNGLQAHKIYLFPFDPNTSDTAKFCIFIPTHDGNGLHNGAVHAD